MAELMRFEEASSLIRSGTPLLLAGDAEPLSRLPRGEWIGGTTPYFMAREGGLKDRERVFVTQLGPPVVSASIRTYGEGALEQIVRDYPTHGCSFIILPGGSRTHLAFGRSCTTWTELFNSPLVGWNSGVDLAELETSKPRVFDGTRGEWFEEAAAVLHASLDSQHDARIEIVNPFSQSDGAVFAFPDTGFEVFECLVDGEPTRLADYINQHQVDIRWPLVADYAGASINVSFMSADRRRGLVRFYSPVFEGVEYRLAKPVVDLTEVFGREFDARGTTPTFACNCILNYLYAGLEGRHTGEATGPITFGEIAYIQLNQTLVYVTFEAVA